MTKILYTGTNPYSCQGVRLTPGNNDVDNKKVSDFINHPGVIHRINSGIIKMLDNVSDVKVKDESLSEEVKVEDDVSKEEVKEVLEVSANKPNESLEKLVIDKYPVKHIVGEVRKSTSVSVLSKIVELTDKVRVRKAAEERIAELVRNR